MSRLHKSAGIVEMETWQGGWPRWVRIKVGEQSLEAMKPEDLRDLRYCADRLLAMIEATGGDAA